MPRAEAERWCDVDPPIARSARGEGHYAAELSEAEVREILHAFHVKGWRPSQIHAARFEGRVSYRNIWAICTGRAWRHIERPDVA